MKDNTHELAFSSIQSALIKKETTQLVKMNDTTRQFGLALSDEEAKELVVSKNETLRLQERIELGDSILNKLIYAFCDSSYLSSNNYLETLTRLQEAFFLFKNESMENLTDDELLDFMREQFETTCFGDVDYLVTTCLPRFVTAIKAGYEHANIKDKKTAYEKLSTEVRWDKDLYMQVVKELFW